MFSTRIPKLQHEQIKLSEMKPAQQLQQKMKVTIPEVIDARQINEYLQTAQSQNQYYQQKIKPNSMVEQKIQNKTFPYQINQNSYEPIKRKRRKSRRQRTVHNNHLDDVNQWPDRLISKITNSMKFNQKSVINREFLDNANNIAFAISLSPEKSTVQPYSNIKNQIESINFKKKMKINDKMHSNLKKDESVVDVPFATSTSLGRTEKIVVTSSRTISKSTDKTDNIDGKPNSTHRKETLKHRTSTDYNGLNDKQNQWKNKYNIDYDNRLEDEYEIIMKDE